MLKSALTVAKKDLYSEWKTKETITSMLIFSLLVVLVFSFAFDPVNQNVKALIPGLIWVIVVLGGILGLNRSFTAEARNDTIYSLIIAPLDPSAIYLGKLIANFILILIVEAVSIPFLILLFNYEVPTAGIGYLIITLITGTFGFVSVGTFLAALSSQSRSAEMMLPILLFPVVSPLLIFAVQATKILLTNMEKVTSASLWIQYLVAFDIIIFVACFILYEYIQEV